MGSVGNRIRGLRRKKAWTQTSLGQHMTQAGHRTWTHGTVRRVEVGVRRLTFAEANTLAGIFHVSLEDLAHNDDEPEQVFASHVARLLAERHDLCVRLVELDRLLAVHAPPTLQRRTAMPERTPLGQAEEPADTEDELLVDTGAAPPPDVTTQDDGQTPEPDSDLHQEQEDTR